MLREMFYAALLVCFALGSCVYGKAQNFTIDDGPTGDERTGQKVVYLGSWNVGNGCSDCAKRPDPARAHSGTWHDTSIFAPQPPNNGLTFNFKGTAVRIYAILAKGLPTSLDITVDNANPEGHSLGFNQTDAADFLYDVPVFSRDGMEDAEHTVTVMLRQNPEVAWTIFLFDYIIYTTETTDTINTAPPPTPTSTALETSSSPPDSAHTQAITQPIPTRSATSTHFQTSQLLTTTSISGTDSRTQTTAVTVPVIQDQTSQSTSQSPVQVGTTSPAAAQIDHHRIRPAILCAAIAGPIFLVLLSLFVWCLFRHRSNRQRKMQVSPFVGGAPRQDTTTTLESLALGTEKARAPRLLSDPKTQEPSPRPSSFFPPSRTINTPSESTSSSQAVRIPPAEHTSGHFRPDSDPHPHTNTSAPDPPHADLARVRAELEELRTQHPLQRELQMIRMEIEDLREQNRESLPEYSPPLRSSPAVQSS
ncbi:hypothetical protein BXZ70DRAFT_929620 [Cristinia sonorae]|uniref:Uncharacterized protein n=1 Tax=Cristinia sonorae TaxID=1940300 RepID=A0A8K0XRM1_9AGAR|nr:hypothetical protein BXZ70DRAFT_929620 [Cristinia sonorae]